jgi:hypothetical protein
MYKLSIAASYYKLRRETKRQYNWVMNRVKELKTDIPTRKAIKKAHEELKSNEVIFHEYYSLPLVYNSSFANTETTNFSKKHFITAKEYLILTESYDRFVILLVQMKKTVLVIIYQF